MVAVALPPTFPKIDLAYILVLVQRCYNPLTTVEGVAPSDVPHRLEELSLTVEPHEEPSGKFANRA
jgi:hypothetical protein